MSLECVLADAGFDRTPLVGLLVEFHAAIMAQQFIVLAGNHRRDAAVELLEHG